jgi:rfaE bifunctional protein nucleotidyltransferase chain/domain
MSLDKTAVMVTTFLRDDLLIRCIDSIRQYYPDIPVFVGDNGHENQPKRDYLKAKGCQYLTLPFDLGVSGVRNETLKLIPPEYEYLMIVEDDCIFTEKTKIETLREILDHDLSLGLCGCLLMLKEGREQHYEAKVYRENGVHYIEKIYDPEWRAVASGAQYTLYDLVLNVFLMRRKVWEDNPWDEQFKTALEHCDFFMGLQTKTSWKVGYTRDVSMKHFPELSDTYRQFRARPVGWKLFGAKWGLAYVCSDYNAEQPLSYEAMGSGVPVDLKGDNLKIVVDTLRQLDCTWWLEAGTCLGAIREKDFIPHDPDIDIGLHPRHVADWDKIREAFVAAGFEPYREWTHGKLKLELSFCRNGVKLDLFFFREAGDYWWHGAFGPDKHGAWGKDAEFLPHVFSASLFKELKLVVFHNLTCYVPDPPERYLVERYGSKWPLRNRNYRFWKDCRAIDRHFLKKGQKTVYIGGAWDLFHIGHVNILERAKRLGTKLIVGVLTDEAVEGYKPRPIIAFEDRKRIVESLSIVDRVIVQHDQDPTADLTALGIKPAYIVHGSDWNYCPGEAYARANGGKAVILPYTPGISTTEIKRRIEGIGAPRPVITRKDRIAVCIKTFLRDEVMFRTVEHVKKNMPSPFRLYIADDGRPSDRKALFYQKLKAEGHFIAELPFDSGLSFGRNALLKQVKEDYVLLLDDDTVIKDAESVGKLRVCLDTDADLALIGAVLKREGGAWFAAETYSKGLKFDRRDKLLVRQPAGGEIKKAGEFAYRYADQVPNVFLAKREVFDEVRWDNRIKIEYEHMDFFLELQKTHWKAGICLDAEAIHFVSNAPPEYTRCRHTAPAQYFLTKHGLSGITNQF